MTLNWFTAKVAIDNNVLISKLENLRTCVNLKGDVSGNTFIPPLFPCSSFATCWVQTLSPESCVHHTGSKNSKHRDLPLCCTNHLLEH